MQRRGPLGLALALGILTGACGGAGAPVAASPTAPAAATAAASPTPATEGELVVYSARREELMKPIVDAFVGRTGIKVTLKSGSAGELGLLIEQEKSSPRGDVHFTTDAAVAESLRQKGLLEPYVSPNAARIPAEFKAADGSWTGVIGRARVFMINTTVLKRDDAPKSVFELTDPKWKNKVMMSSLRDGGVRLWLAWLILERGEAATVKFIGDLKANGLKVVGSHPDVQKAVGRGEVPIGLLNHYYYVFEKKSGSPVDIVYPDQGPGDIGTLVTPLAVGILKGTRHPKASRAFVDFLLSAEGAEPLSKQESEFPLQPGVGLGESAVPGVLPIDRIKRPSVDFTKLAAAEKRAVELFTPLLSAP